MDEATTMTDLPAYYFRIRHTGAIVFRITTDNPDNRIDMDQIAVVNTRRGDYKAHGDRTLTTDDEQAISDWLNARTASRQTRARAQVDQLRETVNRTAQWAQTEAGDDDLDDVTDDLLMAMHDLRQVLVRKRAERLR
ncbi:hypothetical protein [Yoonia sp. 2307UL14-13]|uniref:hypothetical protein n=1 Tax=Yoonia sp. 2307UL14-13 TaxID=3126506 RepID=UPI0030ACEF99